MGTSINSNAKLGAVWIFRGAFQSIKHQRCTFNLLRFGTETALTLKIKNMWGDLLLKKQTQIKMT
jgi:hypothetical protein